MYDSIGVQEFYADKTVFLTGATGFLGKVITEKLLRTCPDVKMIYLFIRMKKGRDSQERINELFDSPIFDKVKKENPAYRKKVTLIAGDLSLPDMGISESDWKTLAEEVSVVFHAGATVRFNEKLITAVNINVSGTKSILNFCGECRNLQALVHISTAYANCNRKEIEEKIYTSPISADEIIKLTKCLPDKIMERCTPDLIHGWPNTYVFTKQIAEDLVRSEAISKGIPAAICRPGIVVGSCAEPIPGWSDSIYGPTGAGAAVGIGLLRALHIDTEKKAELVPVDMSVNLSLAIAWDLVRKNRIGDNINEDIPIDSIPVYNFVTTEENPFTWGDYQKLLIRNRFTAPSMKAVWYTTGVLTKYKALHYFFSFLLHLLPALLIDFVLVAARREAQALTIYYKIEKFVTVISYFGTKEWKFHYDNVLKLWTELPENDKKLFNFDMKTLDYDLLLENIVKNVRINIYKETPDTIPAARRRMIMLHIIHRLIQLVFFSTLFWLLWTPLSSLINCILNLTIY